MIREGKKIYEKTYKNNGYARGIGGVQCYILCCDRCEEFDNAWQEVNISDKEIITAVPKGKRIKVVDVKNT